MQFVYVGNNNVDLETTLHLFMELNATSVYEMKLLSFQYPDRRCHSFTLE